jgi:hypothetical protein
MAVIGIVGIVFFFLPQVAEENIPQSVDAGREELL